MFDHSTEMKPKPKSKPKPVKKRASAGSDQPARKPQKKARRDSEPAAAAAIPVAAPMLESVPSLARAATAVIRSESTSSDVAMRTDSVDDIIENDVIELNDESDAATDALIAALIQSDSSSAANSNPAATSASELPPLPNSASVVASALAASLSQSPPAPPAPSTPAKANREVIEIDTPPRLPLASQRSPLARIAAPIPLPPPPPPPPPPVASAPSDLVKRQKLQITAYRCDMCRLTTEKQCSAHPSSNLAVPATKRFFRCNLCSNPTAYVLRWFSLPRLSYRLIDRVRCCLLVMLCRALDSKAPHIACCGQLNFSRLLVSTEEAKSIRALSKSLPPAAPPVPAAAKPTKAKKSKSSVAPSVAAPAAAAANPLTKKKSNSKSPKPEKEVRARYVLHNPHAQTLVFADCKCRPGVFSQNERTIISTR